MTGLPLPATRRAPHARYPFNLPRLLTWYVVATLPAGVAGLWSMPAHVPVFLAQAALAVAVCAAWEHLFSRVRNRAPDAAWLAHGWLFALLVPTGTPFVLIAVAVSFGVVLGHHVFGGTGRALVSPALLGVLAVHFGYPSVAAAPDSLNLVTAAALPASAWWPVALEQPGAAVGSTSAFACLLGAALLIRSGAASARVVLGVVAGVAAASMLTASPTPWYWHLIIGDLAFCAAFIATDPSTTALTRAARWGHGLLAGGFTVAIRWLDPTHPDGALFAVLMAGLTVPLLDHLVYRVHAARLRRRTPPAGGPTR